MSHATLDAPTTSSTNAWLLSKGALLQAPALGALPGRGNSNLINYANRTTPKQHGINVRLVLFMIVLGLPVAGISWVAVRGMLNKGITWHGDYAAVNLKALGNFPFDKDSGVRDDVPQRWRDLDGKKIELEGFMFSPNSARQGTEYEFVYNVQRCCIGGPPQVQERVYCHCPPQTPIFAQSDYARVVGVLHVRVVRDKTGSIHSVFDLDVQHQEEL
jgi:hypothetical protein